MPRFSLNHDELCVGIVRNDPNITKFLVLNENGLDLQRLVAALSRNTVVKSVEFYKSNNTGRLLWGDLLRVNNTITKLVTGKHSLCKKGPRLLAAGLESNSSLTHLNLERNGISDVGPIFGALKTNTSLRHLNLSFNRIHTGWGPVARDALRANRTLTELDVSRTSMGDESMRVLAAGLEGNSSLNRLDLSFNDLTDARAIFGSLKSNTSLWYLNLSGNEFCTGWGPTVSFALRVNRTLTELNMTFSKIDDENARVIAAGLEGNSALTRLNLSKNKINDAEAIFRALETNTSLRDLDLSYNPSRKGWVLTLGDALRGNSTLTNLSLLCLNIGDDDASALFEALSKSRTALRKLDLERTKITDATWPSLRKFLDSEACVLEVLDLSRNEMGNMTATHLAAVLGNERCTLRSLRSDSVTPVGLGCLGDALERNTSLRSLGIVVDGKDSPGDEGLARFFAALAHNKTLTYLYLYWGGSHGKAWVRALAPALAQNSTLTHLELVNCPVSSGGPLGEALVFNETLKSLNISNNIYRIGGVSTFPILSSVAALNCALTHVNIDMKGERPQLTAPNVALREREGGCKTGNSERGAERWGEVEVKGEEVKVVAFLAPVFIESADGRSPPELVKIALRTETRPDGLCTLRLIAINPNRDDSGWTIVLYEAVTEQWSVTYTQGTKVHLSSSNGGESGSRNLIFDFALPPESIAKVADGPPTLCTAEALLRLAEKRASRFAYIVSEGVAAHKIAALVAVNPDHEDLIGGYLGPLVSAAFAETMHAKEN